MVAEMEAILLVDDDPMQLEYYSAVLESRFRVLSAQDVVSAIRMLESHRVAAVICDLHLDRYRSGIDVVTWISEHLPDLIGRTIILSGDITAKLQGYGASVIFKPVDPGSLLDAIESRVGA